MRRLWGERSPQLTIGVPATLYVFVVAAGDLSLQPLIRLHAATLVMVGLALPALWLTRSCWRRGAPLALAMAAGLIIACIPNALVRAPDPGAGRGEALGLTAGLAVALSVVAVSGLPLRRACRPRLAALRLGWFLALLLSLLVAGVELATDRHLWVGPGLGWADQSRTIIAGAFRNPNDFAIALSAMISGTLAWAASRRCAGSLRVVVGAALAAGVLAVLLTESRSGLLTLLVILGLHAWGWWRRRTAQRPDGGPVLSRRSVAAAGVLLGLTAIGLCTLPTLARYNPLVRLVRAAADPSTARSDGLRVGLLRAGWRYFTASDGFGTGADSFEPLLQADPRWNFGIITWLHNSFLELLLQYGVIPAAALAAVIGVILVTVWRYPGGPEHDLARIEALSALVAFLALGCASATVLTTPVWWLILGQATCSAWWLSGPVAQPTGPRRVRSR
ncbi:O-antigen ligase family protein [Gephyromycinifex aptenodytis]|uniref:O-antigen ligase family protein n=1 Tax=Gephyromycinifex aptenodytis TaxID=2716227 RepID=UPI0014472288|nr:O-antigen ligase family protein [Gephyromycinifex aptenodytis]